MENLFSVLAEVSFAAAGLVLVVFAADTDSRRFWFQNPARRLYVGLSLGLIFLPGFISIGGLIPSPYSDSPIGWSFWAFAFGIAYLFLALIIPRVARKLEGYEELEPLQKSEWSLRSIGILSLVLVAIGVLEYLRVRSSFLFPLVGNSPETLMGLVLLGSLGLIVPRIGALLAHLPLPASTQEPRADNNSSPDYSLNQPDSRATQSPVVLAVTVLALVTGFMLGIVVVKERQQR